MKPLLEAQLLLFELFAEARQLLSCDVALAGLRLQLGGAGGKLRLERGGGAPACTELGLGGGQPRAQSRRPSARYHGNHASAQRECHNGCKDDHEHNKDSKFLDCIPPWPAKPVLWQARFAEAHPGHAHGISALRALDWADGIGPRAGLRRRDPAVVEPGAAVTRPATAERQRAVAEGRKTAQPAHGRRPADWSQACRRT